MPVVEDIGYLPGTEEEKMQPWMGALEDNLEVLNQADPSAGEKQMKTLNTRAGPGTKVVCLGNIAQIDTPYLTEGSSGITYVVDRFKGWPHSGHVTLERGERSRLADFAADAL